MLNERMTTTTSKETVGNVREILSSLGPDPNYDKVIRDIAATVGFSFNADGSIRFDYPGCEGGDYYRRAGER